MGSLDIASFTADDTDEVAALVSLSNAVAAGDAPWLHPDTVAMTTRWLRHGWDGEPPIPYLARHDGRVVGRGTLNISEWDNTHIAWVGLAIHPDERRRGFGSELWEFMVDRAREHGRTTVGTDGWDSERATGFADRHGLTKASQAINRRQVLADLDPVRLDRMYDDALAASADYELLRLEGRIPDDLIAAVAEMTASINDAPTDDLDLEDEVFPVERIRDYERAHVDHGVRLYRVVARHRASGELAGHTVVAVEEERPWFGDQHDTSVVRAHRGHRLGLLLKIDMIRWLAEREPKIETVDTWNAESNDHMIEVNEQLAYHVLGRELQFQRRIASETVE